MKKLPIIFCIVILLVNFSYAAIGDWTTYTNMNYVQKMLVQQDQIFCATTGGAFIFDIQDSSVTRLTNVDGLGGNVLYSLAIDTSGAFWFGADNGTLSKYNPNNGNFIVYDDFYDSEKGNLKLNHIQPDQDKLWVASNIGVSLFLIHHNGGEIKETYKRLGENLEVEIEVNCVHLVGDVIWAGTEKGIAFANKNDPYLQDYTRWVSFTTTVGNLPRLGNDFIYCITNIEDTIYVGTKTGVFRFILADSSWEEVGLGSRQIKDLKYFKGYLTAATDNGVYKYDLDSWKQLPNSGLLSTNLNYVVIDSSSNLWVATEGKGIAKYDTGTSSWQNYSINGPPNNIFEDIAIDNQSVIWCAHGAGKVSSFDGTNWTTYDSIIDTLADSTIGNGIERVKEYPNGTSWFGSWGGGLFKRDIDGNWTKYNESNSPLKGVSTNPNYVVVFGITVDMNRNIWFANRETRDSTLLVVLQRDTDSSWAVFKISSELPFPGLTVNYIMAKDNHLWVCFRDYGITDFKFVWTPEGEVCTTSSCIDECSLRTYNTSDWLPSNEVITCNIDKDTIVWVGTTAGLSYRNDYYDVFLDYALPDSQGPQVNTIVVDERNRKWIGTAKGFCILDDGEFAGNYYNSEYIGNYYPSNSKLVGPYVNKIVMNNITGDVWIATESGLSKYEHGLPPVNDDLSLVTVRPSPFILKDRNDKLTFDRLPYQAKIKIFTLAGELVKEIDSGDQWDGTNQAGKLVAGGIYLFYVYDQQGRSTVGKIALIRE